MTVRFWNWAVLLICIAFLASSLGKPELPPEKTDFFLECAPVLNSFSEGSVYLVRCDFTNKTKKTLELKTGFFGVELLAFGLAHENLSRNRSYPSGGFDNEYHSYSVAPGATYTTFVALNDWMDLPVGTSRIEVRFAGRKLPLVSSFDIVVTEASDARRKRELDAFVELGAKRGAMGARTVDLNWALASACRRNGQILREIKAMATQCPPGSPKREFLDSILIDKAWNAVD
jgi:hypothetical protein